MRWVPLLAALLAAVLAFLSSANASPTADEPTYVGQGAYIARTGDFAAPVLLWQPPLALYVTSAGLAATDLPADAFGQRPPADSLTALGDRLIFDAPSAPAAVLRASRLGVIVVFAGFAALAAWLAGRLGGAVACALAGALVAAQPMFYAHGGLATTDAVAAATALLAMTPLALGFVQVRATATAVGAPWTMRHASMSGAALGLAVLAKHTALALVPIVIVATVVLARRGGATRRRAAALVAVAAVVAAIVVWAGYGFDMGTLVPEGSTGDLAGRLGPDAPWAGRAARTIDVPAPMFWRSLVFQASKQHGRLYFHYFGEIRKEGWWTYFPMLALGKATLGSLVLVGIAAATARRRRLDSAEWLLVAAFALPFAAAIASRHNLGVRHVLPALAPVCVLVAVRIGRDAARAARTLAIAGAMAVLHLAEGVGAGPDALAWWNLAAGGVSGGWRIATGANADWGQSVWRLRDEVRARGMDDVWVIPSGPASSIARLEGDGLRVFRDATRREPLPERGWLAISTSAWRTPPHDPVTDAPPDLFLAGCYRVYRLPLASPRTP